MKIICAGYPKTGSKSCSTALRELGYKVADYMETAEFISFAWRDYIQGKVGIEKVLAAYEEHGFDCNQDIPGNILWEDLYRASPKGTKVILTVRDDDARWWKSWCGFMTQELERDAIGDFCVQTLLNKFMVRGYFGPQFLAMYQAQEIICREYLDPSLVEPSFSVKKSVSDITRNEKKLRAGYVKHNLYVQSIVPREDLLVWNLKDGWKPLCDFLGKPVPDGPIPHDNRTGDKDFIKKYAFENDFFKTWFFILLF